MSLSMRGILIVAELYLRRGLLSTRTLTMMALTASLLAVMIVIPFLGVPFTPITEAALRVQAKTLAIQVHERVPEQVVLSMVFLLTQGPLIATLFACLASLWLVTMIVVKDKTSGFFERLLALPISCTELVLGLLLAVLVYGLVFWSMLTLLFLGLSYGALTWFTGSASIRLPEVYYVNLLLVSPLLVLVTLTLAVYVAVTSPQLARHTIPASMHSPLTLLALAPLMVYIAILNIPAEVNLVQAAYYTAQGLAITEIALLVLIRQIAKPQKLLV